MPSEGWTEIKYVQEIDSCYFQLVDGSYIHGGLVCHFYKTDEATIGWAPQENSFDSQGYFFDISPESLAEVSHEMFCRGLPPMRNTEYYTPMRATVYNIEVTDFHTYYVSDLGFWVHNKNYLHGNVVLGEFGSGFIGLIPLAQ